MDLRMCSHGVPHEFGPCEHCQEVAQLRAKVEYLTEECARDQYNAAVSQEESVRLLGEVERLTLERDLFKKETVALAKDALRYKLALEMYADESRWSRAWGDDESLLYNIRADKQDGWAIAQEALTEAVQP